MQKYSKYERAKKSYSRWRNRGEGRAFIAILFSMNEGKCPRCGVPMFLAFDEKMNLFSSRRATLDHVVPLIETQTHDKNNLAICCSGCNRDKGLENLIIHSKKETTKSKQLNQRKAV